MVWTEFFDKASGGSGRTRYSAIYIEAPEEEARRVFAKRFSDPDNVTCECCGPDYDVEELDSDDFRAGSRTLVIRKGFIAESERLDYA